MIARWLHLAASIGVVGTTVMLLLAGRSDRPTARAWAERIGRWSIALLLLALLAGLATLMEQTARLEGRPGAAFEPAALLRVLLETHGGRVWAARHGFLLLLGAFLILRPDVERALDWRALGGETAALGLIALGLGGFAGHATAAEPDAAAAIAIDVVHLLAAGVWAGGFLPLALLMRAAGAEAGADARPYAVRAARRFSGWALVAVAVLVVSGAGNALTQVGSVAGLVGTTYGRLLLAKLALLVPLLGLGATNRLRVLPALSGEAVRVGRPAMRRLTRLVLAEAVLAALVLLLVAAMSLTAPARHEPPTWPFGVRLSTAGLADSEAASRRVLIGSQVALLGVVAVGAALLLRSRRRPLLATAGAMLAVGIAIAMPPLLVDAYPTTYVRPTVPYHAASIVGGQALYTTHCASCHGPSGAGDGPAGRALSRPPADLRSGHTGAHTAGDLFWWIGHGIPASGMPGFAAQLREDERWDLVNFLRALAAGETSRTPGPRPATPPLGPVVERDRPWLAAPDFSFAVGPTPDRRLSDYRGRRVALVVLYALPGSRPRLAQLGEGYDVLVVLGVEVIAVPIDARPDALKRLGPEPRLLFPVVTDGAADIVAAYRLLAQEDGLFVEPASAASVAGLLKLAASGYFRAARRLRSRQRLVVVCILTGHGLKDPERAIQSLRVPKPVPPSLSVITKAVGLK